MTITKVFAPAKINLTLHVTGQRSDGYHILDSLVAFADLGDRVTVIPAEETSLEVTGPMSDGVPADGSNLVMKAAALFDQPVHILLSKHLPAAAGIGGGSSDAAATILAMAELTGNTRLPAGVTELGADVRICLIRQAARMRGIGEDVSACPAVPTLHAVLANPRVAVSTPHVFRALKQKSNAPMPKSLPNWKTADAFITWLKAQRNDLETPAIELAPVIAVTLDKLSALPGAILTRMSGSGATCFALFADEATARNAASALQSDQSSWWVSACRLT